MPLLDTTRRRLVWTALVISLAFLVATLALAAIDAVTPGWYAAGAIIYGAAFLVAIVAWLAKPEAKPWTPLRVEPLPAPRPATLKPPVSGAVRDRVLYSTPHGRVVERVGPGPGHGFIVERDAGAAQAKDVDAALAAAAARPARPPSEQEMDRALRRWGQVHEVR